MPGAVGNGKNTERHEVQSGWGVLSSTSAGPWARASAFSCHAGRDHWPWFAVTDLWLRKVKSGVKITQGCKSRFSENSSYLQGATQPALMKACVKL